jgi:hypothetical protein
MAEAAAEGLRDVEAAAVAALAGVPASSVTTVNASTPLPLIAPGATITVVVYNALAVWRTMPACRSLSPSQSTTLSVSDMSTGSAVASQVVPTLQYLVSGSADDAQYELCFAVRVPPLGFSSYAVSATAAGMGVDEVDAGVMSEVSEARVWAGGVGSPIQLSNGQLRALFDASTGALSQLQSLTEPGVSIVANHSFGSYPDIGNVYQFIPMSNASVPVSLEGVTVHVSTGSVVSTVYQVVSSSLGHAMRLYTCAECGFLESAVIVGPIEMNTCELWLLAYLRVSVWGVALVASLCMQRLCLRSRRTCKRAGSSTRTSLVWMRCRGRS